MNNIIEVALKSHDSLYLSVSLFETVNPKAVIQIIHGAKDHKERYYEFIKWLNANGFNVVIKDIRGHGKSVNNKYTLGYIESLNEMIEDEHIITNYIKNRYPDLDIYMFGHSLGSMIAQIYLENYDLEIKKLVLSGPVNYDEQVNIGLFLGKWITKLFGKRKYSDLLNGFANFNTDTWLVSNPTVLESYRNDPLCNFKYTNQAMLTILNANKELNNYKNYKGQNKLLSILIISGELDKIAGGLPGLNETINKLNKVGYSNIQNIVYPNMKHEVLNEYNKEKVFTDIIKFYLN